MNNLLFLQAPSRTFFVFKTFSLVLYSYTDVNFARTIQTYTFNYLDIYTIINYVWEENRLNQLDMYYKHFNTWTL